MLMHRFLLNFLAALSDFSNSESNNPSKNIMFLLELSAVITLSCRSCSISDRNSAFYSDFVFIFAAILYILTFILFLMQLSSPS